LLLLAPALPQLPVLRLDGTHVSLVVTDGRCIKSLTEAGPHTSQGIKITGFARRRQGHVADEGWQGRCRCRCR
jgi:hypothetical protein